MGKTAYLCVALGLLALFFIPLVAITYLSLASSFANRDVAVAERSALTSKLTALRRRALKLRDQEHENQKTEDRRQKAAADKHREPQIRPED
jgi:hypothetical protein